MSRHVRELFDLSDKRALITGSSRGLGLQIAEALGEAGARVMLTARHADELWRAREHLRARDIRAECIAGDAAKPDEIARVSEQTLERFGQLDVLVNNAGAAWGAPAEDHPLGAWDKIMNINVRSVFLFSQYIAKHSMIPRRAGRIIMVASIAGLGGNVAGHETAAYNTSKAAVINLGRALAGEWAEFGITVNSIAPGWFPSKMARGTIEARGIDEVTSHIPLGRLGDDEDLKGAVILFASTAGKHITGQVLAIDGGASAVIG